MMRLAWWLIVTALWGPAAHAAPNPDLNPQDASLCRAATERLESAGYVPGHLLTALSHVETGRWDTANNRKVAWPWTINANGVGRFFTTKAAAIEEVQRLQRLGVVLIDVGCMQINLHHHRNAFASLEAAFDPNTNAAYAAKFMRDLAVETGSWMRAAARYHSAEPERASIYHAKVIAALRALDSPGASGHTPAVAAFGASRSTLYAARSTPPSPPPLDPAIAAREEMSQGLASEQHDRNVQAARAFADAWRQQQLDEYAQSEAQRHPPKLAPPPGIPPSR